MSNKISYIKILLHALRTALIFIAGFLSYELLKNIEIKWNKTHPDNEIHHFTKRKIYHFIVIFCADIIILYLIAILFDIHL